MQLQMVDILTLFADLYLWTSGRWQTKDKSDTHLHKGVVNNYDQWGVVKSSMMVNIFMAPL